MGFIAGANVSGCRDLSFIFEACRPSVLPKLGQLHVYGSIFAVLGTCRQTKPLTNETLITSR